MGLRKGKTKSTLESSIEASLLAVEIYNKPRTPFRVEGFITQMIISWTRLFHAYFNNTIGEKYYYKKPNGHYKIVDGEKKSWELKTCIKEYGKLKTGVKENLSFFIKLRNKIEHRHIDKDEIGIMIFGECQSLLYNYENFLVEKFGEDYAINESLSFSLQFSRTRKKSQIKASKELLSKEVLDLKNFIDTYKKSLSDEVFNTQEYSIKLIQIPKISNTNRSDLAIEFVNWNSLSEDDRKHYQKVTAIIKDKIIKQEAVNISKRKPGYVVEKVNKAIQFDSKSKFNHHDHKCLYFTFKIRPSNKDNDPFNTNTKYCHYDEAHEDYLYQDEWIDFIIQNLKKKKFKKENWKEWFKKEERKDIKDFE